MAKGMSAYTITMFIEENGGKTKVRISAKIESIVKYDMKNSAEIAKDVIEDIERQIGAKLERT